MNSRKCEICYVDVHRASYTRHLRNKKQLENEKLNEMITPEWLLKNGNKKLLKMKSTNYIVLNL